MNEKITEMLDDFSITFEMSVKETNALLNCLNMPSQTPAMTASYFINLIQNQAKPQVEKAQKSLEAVAKANEEKKNEG